jgi:hypothetical protein
MLASFILCLKLTLDFFGAVWRDLVGVKKLIAVKDLLNRFEKDNTNTAERFACLVKQQPNKPCIVFNDVIWTFQQVKLDLSTKIFSSTFYFNIFFNLDGRLCYKNSKAFQREIRFKQRRLCGSNDGKQARVYWNLARIVKVGRDHGFNKHEFKNSITQTCNTIRLNLTHNFLMR